MNKILGQNESLNAIGYCFKNFKISFFLLFLRDHQQYEGHMGRMVFKLVDLPVVTNPKCRLYAVLMNAERNAPHHPTQALLTHDISIDLLTTMTCVVRRTHPRTPS